MSKRKQKVPPKIDGIIKEIARLPLPSTEFEDMLRKREYEYEKSRKEHERLGNALIRYVKQRFSRALGSAYYVSSTPSRGYLLDWSYEPNYKKRPHKIPVRPFIELNIYLPHGRLVGPSSNRRVAKYYGDGRCMVTVTYFPHSGEDLGLWCERWVDWLKSAPELKEPAELQVCI